MEKSWEYNLDIHHIFIDFKQAYDSILRGQLWKILTNFGIPRKLVTLVKMCMEGSHNIIKIDGQLSEPFTVLNGLRQGDALSPVLFNFALEWVMRKIQEIPRIFTARGMKLILAYADDIDIISDNLGEATRTYMRLEEEAKKIGLTINEQKTKYMHMKRYSILRTPSNLSIGNASLQKTHEFKYLGTLITDDNVTRYEIQERIQNSWKCIYGLKQLLKSNALRRGEKIKIYKTIIQPITMYGSETWTLTKYDEESLRRFERKVLRLIYGPVRNEEGGGYRIRTNRELQELYQQADMVQLIKANRLGWAGHMLRAETNRTIGRVWKATPTTKRPLGRPRMRWRDNIQKDLRALGVEDLETSAQDRGRWGQIVREAKIHTGL